MVGVEHNLLQELREAAQARRDKPAGAPPPLTLGQRCADTVAAYMGSWRFIIAQSLILFAWVLFNSLVAGKFDPYPFILLNLVLSFQAAYSAPIIMMSQNRQADIDRARAIEDYDVNRKAELEIESLHAKIDLLREKEVAALSAAVDRLTRLLESERRA